LIAVRIGGAGFVVFAPAGSAGRTAVAKYDNREERRVIAGSERHAATTLGEDVRHDHRGWTYRVDSPVKR